MAYNLEEIAHALKAARQAKGLSQRALSVRTGLTQAQISRVENAAVDLQLSTLIELTRALDLELTLIPRRAVPAVQSITREASSTAPSGYAHLVLRMLRDAARKLSTRLPDPEAIQEIYSAASSLQSVPLSKNQIETLREAALEGQRVARSLKDKAKESPLPPAELEKIREIMRQIHGVRINIAHALSSETSDQPRPAYRLDEDASNG